MFGRGIEDKKIIIAISFESENESELKYDSTVKLSNVQTNNYQICVAISYQQCLENK